MKKHTTNCIKLGEEKEQVPYKPIEFCYQLIAFTTEKTFIEAMIKPKEYLNIELIKSDYLLKSDFVEKNNKEDNNDVIDNENVRSYQYDLMFAYDNDRNLGVLYLGFWNSGKV